MTIAEIALIVAMGIGVGVLSALFGVGGGIVMVPFLVLVVGETQHVAEGTSLAVIVPTAIAGVIAHRKTGYVSWRTVAFLGAGGVLGAVAGARAALLLEGDVLRRLFAIAVLVVGARLIVQGLSLRRGPTGSEG